MNDIAVESETQKRLNEAMAELPSLKHYIRLARLNMITPTEALGSVVLELHNENKLLKKIFKSPSNPLVLRDAMMVLQRIANTTVCTCGGVHLQTCAVCMCKNLLLSNKELVAEIFKVNEGATSN